MPTFRPPYGTADQHVTDPAEHLGYHYVVARLVDGGLGAEYIRRACEEFHEAGAPKGVLCQYDGRWMTRDDLTNLTVRRHLDGYAAALAEYERELKAEQGQQRFT